MSDAIREQIVKVAKLMYEKGMVNAFAGNLSVRDGNNVYITPSGICKGFLKEDMIVKTDMNGNILEGMYKPSSEIKLHLEAYKKRKDIYSVVHAILLIPLRTRLPTNLLNQKRVLKWLFFLERYLLQHTYPSTDEIFSGVEEYINEYDVILLANHGIVSFGRDVFDAYFKLEAAEDIAKTLILSRLLGGEKDLPENKLKELDDMRKKRRTEVYW